MNIEDMSTPPVVGQRYMVPALYWRMPYGPADPLEGDGLWWPVIGCKHDDIEFFNFQKKHYHIDIRFLHQRHLVHGHMRDFLGSPLCLPDGSPLLELPHPTLHRLRCKRNSIDFEKIVFQSPVPAINKLRCAYEGVQCRRDEQGWVCPHRLVKLGSVKPIDGVITCFLHGLRIDAATGICLPEPKGNQG